MRSRVTRHGWLLPASLGLGIPILIDPHASDGLVLPRASLAIVGATLAVVLRLWSPLDVPSDLGKLRGPALAVILAAVLALAFSVAPALSVIGAYERYDDAIVRVAYVGLFAASAWLLPRPRDRRRVVTWFLIGCCAAALEAIWEFWHDAIIRPDGNVGHPNLLGVLVAMSIVLVANRARSDRRWLLPLPLLAAALLLTGSRSAWLGEVAGLSALAVLLVRRERRLLVGAGVGLVVLGALLVTLFSPLRSLGSDTGSSRLHVWSDSVALIAARPLTGWGEESFGLVYGQFQRGPWENALSAFDRAHSEPIDLLATQGVVGVLAAGWFWGVFWRGLLSRVGVEEAGAIGAAWIAYAIWALLNFDWVAATGPLWLISGVAWAAAHQPETGSRRGRLLPAWASAAVTVALLAAVAWRALLPPIADRLQFAGACAAAASLDPLQPYYHAQCGIAAIDSGDLATAEAELTRAVNLGDEDAGDYVELGDVKAALGKPNEARTAYQDALKISPFYPGARSRLGRG